MSHEPAISALLGPVQLALSQERVRGWLLYDLRGRSLVASRLLGLGGAGTERRFFYWIPAEGLPVAIVHEDDAPLLPELPGDRARYRTAIELRAALEAHVPREGTVLVEQAPFAQIADLAVVDEATLSLLRGRDTVVRSSLELANRFAGPLSEAERDEVGLVSTDLTTLRATIARVASSRALGSWDALWGVVEEEADARALELCRESGFAIDANARSQRATERLGGAMVPGAQARLDLWVRRRRGHGVVVPASLDVVVGEDTPAGSRLRGLLRTVEDELLETLVERASRPRVLGSEVAELSYDAIRRRGLSFTSSCVGWPLGDVARGSHACTFDAEGFADPRELVPGTMWALRLGVDDGQAIAWRTTLIERVERGLRITAPAGECLVLARAVS